MPLHASQQGLPLLGCEFSHSNACNIRGPGILLSNASNCTINPKLTAGLTG